MKLVARIGTSKSGVKVPDGCKPSTTPLLLMSFTYGSGRNCWLVRAGSNFAVFVFTFIEKSTPIRSNHVSESEMMRISTATARSCRRRRASSKSCTSRITSAVWLTTRAPPKSKYSMRPGPPCESHENGRTMPVTSFMSCSCLVPLSEATLDDWASGLFCRVPEPVPG